MILIKNNFMTKEQYLVQHYNNVYGPEFSIIEDEETLNIWLKDGSLRSGDKIYVITLLGEVKEETTRTIKNC